MTISKKQLEEAKQDAYVLGKDDGYWKGKEDQRKKDEENFNIIRRRTIIDVAEYAALLAKANASLTYSLSKLIEQVK